MSVRFFRGRALRAACALAGGVLVLTACSNTESSGPEVAKVEGISKVDAIAAQLPEDIKNSGKLIVGVNVPYAPNEFKDPATGEIIGFDVDLMDAIAQVLGVTAEYQESDFEKIIPSIEVGTYNLGMSSFTDNKEREQTADFVTYFNAGSQWARKVGSDVDPENACGKRVAVQRTTVQDTDEIPERSAKCIAEGKPEIVKVAYDEQSAAATALVQGQVDAMSADSPVTAYAIKEANKDAKVIEAAGPIFDSAPYGWPVKKGSPLAPVLQQAMQHLIDNGQYRQIAENWGVEEGVIAKSVINGAQG
ncbi:Putative ABC transporter arginine-binding protein 2 precursor [Nocardia otitidiscaviarum]|uniref:ABC transporter arginine-binding protein 2 n=1 Tax=Nocardia otitidiscaviarum TaxID=1823 RepID=A0A379JHW5_9NOCA|nr:ABC transporter substrate-binding protein [Nocardia otitidiscaviarum]MBF6176951.1 ABC transporter substrate-binding protein [Nocardia otitidiscaviarum]MCP9619670.1 ABC transporter substrate-binding protein [Nocardia otitidiscaviarum]QDP78887.1 ABC transporter substrate-binding protein [Nocardia otitidiscaviarum]SUD48249.1 Putative ABC transporter arginine-binding protein 2 precursor [Nocardia otitidiscaviarum]